MRFPVLGREVVNVRDVDESGSLRADRDELAGLIIEPRNAAGEPVFPRAGFGRSESNHLAAVAVLKRANEICFMPRRAKFRAKLARLLAGLQLESEIARSPDRRFGANW